MAHKRQNFIYHAGDDKPIVVQLFEADGVTPVSALDTAAEIRFAVAVFLTDAVPLFTRTKTAGNITVVDIPNAKISISMIKADTVALGGVHEYEIDVDLGGLDETFLTGEVQIAPTVLD